jgi:hypothetical protein
LRVLQSSNNLSKAPPDDLWSRRVNLIQLLSPQEMWMVIADGSRY